MRKSRSQKSKVRSQIFLFSVFCFLLAVLPGCTKREIKNINSKGKNIICFGDSITYGYGANPGEDYPTALRKLVDRPVINCGVDGDTAGLGLQRIKSDVLDKEPYIVLVEFTGNDFIKKVPIDLTISNVKEIIRQVQAAGAMTAIVDVSAGFFLREYRIALSKLARETGSIFIPEALSGIITNPCMKSDFMHPNAGGYKMIAQRAYRVISPYLKENQK